MIRVYTASKLHHWETWRDLQREWPKVFFHARWLRHIAIGTADTPENAVSFWCEDEEDVATADAVLVFAEQGEHLRGALVEAGIAIANNIPVVVVGEHPDYGTWQYHPGVARVPDFPAAYTFLTQLQKDKRR